MKKQSLDIRASGGNSVDAPDVAALSNLAVGLARQSETKPNGGDYPLGAELARMEKSLRAYATKAVDESAKTPVAAWIIDNYPLVHSTLRDIRSSLPRGFYWYLPRLKRDGRARIDEAIAKLVEQVNGALNPPSIDTFFRAYQEVRNLSIAELWSAKHLINFHLIRIAAAEIVKPEPDVQPISQALTSVRKLEAFSWKNFIEELLAVELVLQGDPSGDYPLSDFPTRDHYCHAVEHVARRALRQDEDIADAEVRVARRAIEFAAGVPQPASRTRHVGYWLVDKGLQDLRKASGYRQKIFGNFRDFVRRYPTFHYLIFAFLFTALIIACAWRLLGPVPLWTLLLLLLPALHVALSILNPLVTFTLPPQTLGRLDFSEGVPERYKTFVVVPTLLLSLKNVKELLENIEIHYLANRDRNILFALLTDFADAATAETVSDSLLDVCMEGIEDLNERYANSGQQPFYLFHRPRKWNAGEDKWMGWERKRGKLNDFNEWLLGRSDNFSAKVGDLDRARGVKYVITLDSDTQLPRDTARKMIGMLAHPLNRAVLDPKRNMVVDGYGLVLPRVGVSIQSASKSRLARLYSGKVGYDPYATAVSDVYMDLFGQASFTGKGIYDVETFERAAGRFPDNVLLSHDLIEGEHVRVGLCADQEVIDDFPQRYDAFSKRKHRWVRGDWQIVRWLLPRVPARGGGTEKNHLPPVSRWKIFDNLRRSLMEISMFTLFVVAWTMLPGDGLRWTLIALALFVLPVWFDLIVAAIRIPPPRFIRAYTREVGYRFMQGHLDALITLIFLPHQALLMADAILRTIVRQFITHKHMLEWESMAQAEAAVSTGMSLSSIYMWVASVLALALIVIVPGGEPWSNLAFLLLELWLISPLVSLWLDGTPAQPQGLTDQDRRFLRETGLKTWRYYLDFAGDEDHWLVPDNVQEQPEAIAHRTSPTNIGLQLNAYLVALDFGYLSAEEFAIATSRTLESMGKLARVRGHWLNWYDTRSLATLQPDYLSTVDSGNLAASLLVAKQGCLEAARRTILSEADRRGLIDFVLRLQNELPREERTHAAMRLSDGIVAQLGTEPAGLFFWNGQLSETKSACSRLEKLLENSQDADVLYWLGQLQKRIEEASNHICRFAPWLCEPLEREFRFSFSDPAMEDLLKLLSAVPSYAEMPDHYDSIAAAIRARLEFRRPMHELTREALLHLLDELPRARKRAIELVASLHASATTAAAWVDEMEFGFLFDVKRNLLHIGAHVTNEDAAASQVALDDSYYDLIASEARTAILLGIAKGDLPREAWFQLGRKLTYWRGQHCLVSWSGTMFEYLMPNLFMRSYPGTLLHETMRAVVKVQKAYARERRVPWGISECAYNDRDSLGNYQYHAFGVPVVGARRDFSGRTVVAPYATMLALLASPLAAVENARLMEARKWLGRYGFYEALDFTPARRFGRMEDPVIVRAFMAHHQGMTLLAINSAVLDSPIQRRFHTDPLVQAAEYLLQERAPDLLHKPEDLPVTKEPDHPPDGDVVETGVLNESAEPDALTGKELQKTQTATRLELGV